MLGQAGGIDRAGRTRKSSLGIRHGTATDCSGSTRQLSQEQKDKIKDIVTRNDKDKSKQLSSTEILGANDADRKPILEFIAQALDENCDGSISRTEFAKHVKDTDHKGRLVELFNAIDKKVPKSDENTIDYAAFVAYFF